MEISEEEASKPRTVKALGDTQGPSLERGRDGAFQAPFLCLPLTPCQPQLAIADFCTISNTMEILCMMKVLFLHLLYN